MIATLLIATLVQAAQVAPKAMVEKADQIRNPSESFEMQVKVETADSNQEFAVFLKGNDKTIVVTKSPAKDRGRNMLMMGQDFFAYIPNLKRSMRLSLAQKLSGQVANGDISRTRWADDYTATLEKKDGNMQVLFLKANKDNLTYANIRVWLEDGTFKPIKAEYLNLSGQKVLKRASFEEYKELAGALRPSVVKIVDVAGNDPSYIRVLSMKTRNYPGNFFTERNMETLK